MNEALQKATQLLQNGELEEALLLLNELVYSTPQIEQLKYNCKKELSNQYLWALNDAEKNGQIEEMKKYVTRYEHLIGHDTYIAKYEGMVKNPPSSVISKQQQIVLKNTSHVGDLVLIPAIFLLFSLLLSAFEGKLSEWDFLVEWSYDLDLRSPWVILNYVFNAFCTLYVISATIVFGGIEEKCNSNRSFNPQTIWLFVWSGTWLIPCISDMVCGLNYESFVFVQGIRICLIVGDLSLIVFLVKRITESIKIKIPLIIAVVATGLDIIRVGILLYVGYMQNQYSYGYESLKVYYSIMNVLYYGHTILMVASFIMLFLILQRTKTNNNGTN